MSAQVTLYEEWDSSGPTIDELQTFCAQAIALGLNGYSVRGSVHGPPRGTLPENPDELRAVRSLKVTGPAPDLR